MIIEAIQRYHQYQIDKRNDLAARLEEPMRHTAFRDCFGLAVKTGFFALPLLILGAKFDISGVVNGFHDIIIQHNTHHEMAKDAVETIGGLALTGGGVASAIVSYENGATAVALSSAKPQQT